MKKKQWNFIPRPPIDLSEQEHKLNQLLAEVSACVNRKINDPKALDKFKNAFRSVQPKNLKGGMLKEYQKEALVWMIELAHKNMNGILADDMGLGKTIQTIAYFAYLKQEHGITGKHFIICPLTVCRNWQREIRKWMPDMNVQILWGQEQQRQEGIRKIVKPRAFDILITPYHAAVSAFNVLKKVPWTTFIIDEAHKIKNDDAILTQTVKDYQADFKLLLTGTPLSNRLKQLWSLLNFIMPNIFHDKQLFDDIEDGIKQHDGGENQKFDIQCRIAKKFHGIIRPFIMRRTKKDTDLGLPTKTQQTLYVSMTKLQLKMYKNLLKYKNVYGQNQGYANNSQMSSRKICNHPYLYAEIQSPTADQYGEHLVQNCGKMIVLDKLLAKLINKEKRKVLLFSQFKIQLDILEDYCAMRSYNYFRLDGETDIDDRQTMMSEFNEDKDYSIPIFMLSTKAGGLGVNLVAANVVIIYDIDWNPQNDNQAMDRAYRIGQTKPVNVYKMVTQHTIQERMLQVQKYKLIWDELVIQKGTLMNIKNEDVFSGLNYEKIAMMKKGEIFKLQPTKDNKTIDEIIKMGQIKDEKKYKELKQKVMKQLEQQKSKQNFNPNPFEDNQINDRQGDVLVQRFQGEKVGQKAHKQPALSQVQTQIRARNSFTASLFIPEYHLYINIDAFKDLLWKMEKLKRQHEKEQQQNEQESTHIGNKKEFRQIQVQIEEMKENSFIQWQADEYNIFIEQQKLEISSETDNLTKLHELIPTKSISQIRQYKTAFYSMSENKFLPQIVRQIKLILKTQAENKVEFYKKQFLRGLKSNNICFLRQRNKQSMINLLNNLKISEQIDLPKDFLDSKAFNQNYIVQAMKEIQGQLTFMNNYCQKKVLSAYDLLKRFYKTKDYQIAVENPQKQRFQKQANQRKAKILADIRKKILRKVGSKSHASTQKQPNKIEE